MLWELCESEGESSDFVTRLVGYSSGLVILDAIHASASCVNFVIHVCYQGQKLELR